MTINRNSRKRFLHAKLFLFIVLSVLMLILNHQQTHLKTVRMGLTMVVAPVQYLTNWPTKMINWISESFTDKQTLLSENERLQGQLLLLKARLQKVLLLEQENTQLRALLESLPMPGEKVLVAQLLAIDPDPFQQQVIINKGSNQDVYLGQPVLTGNGVFGQVIQVGEFTSRVLLITDTRSALPVQDSHTRIRGVVVGKGNFNQLALINMPVTANIHVGDPLVTSGLGEKFPVGYPVGIITSIKTNPGASFEQVEVQPSAYLNQGHLVLLVWPSVEKTLQAQKQSHKEIKHGH